MTDRILSRFIPETNVRLALLVSLGFTLLFLAFLPPGIYSVDGNSMLAVAESLVTTHTVDVPQGLGSVGRDGHVYSNWYPLLSLVALPFVALAHPLSQALHLPFHYAAAAFALLVQVPLTAATAGLVALLSLQLGATQRGAWLASVSFGLGTVAMVYVRTFYAEPLLAFIVACSLYLAFRLTPRSIMVCSLFALLAVLAKPPGIFLGFIVSAYLFAKHSPWSRALLPCLGSLSGLLLYAAYNQYRFAAPLQFGQPWTFSPAVASVGIPGLLASPGWGLLWYCPPLLSLFLLLNYSLRSKILEISAVISVLLVFLLFHSVYTNWSGGWSWGPRYLVPALPGLCSLTGLLNGRNRKILVVLSFVGFLLSAPTLFSFYERYLAESRESGVSTEKEITWSVSESPLIHAWPAGIRQVEDATRQDVPELFAQREMPSQEIRNSRALRVVAVWWWVLPITRIPRWIGIIVSAALVCGSLIIFLRSVPVVTLTNGDASSGVR